jgi:hypothetical protein
MGNLLGEPFREYVNSQIKIRQEVHGYGAPDSTIRNNVVISYLNSRNAWVKLASAVSLEENRLNLLKKSNNPMLMGVGTGYDLAQKNVLFNGVTDFKNKDEKFGILNFNPNEVQQEINNSDPSANNSILSNYDHRYAYGVGGTDFGFSPMPGITSVNIKDLNRGSIKKSTINIKAHNRNQFDIIDILYLRLGYTVCLEWGNNIYLSKESYNTTLNEYDKISKIEDTLIDNYFWEVKNEEYSKFNQKINKKREEYEGNYDGIIGVVSNFNWSFENDGTYNITLEITSVGDVIESLRVNLPPLIDVATSANTQNKYNVIKEELNKRKAKQKEFYETLYPGLEDELTRIYNILTDNGSKAIFNYERKTAGNRGGYYVLNIPDSEKYNLEELKVRPDFIQDIDGGQKLVRDSRISQNLQWLSNFYDDTLSDGNINRSPLQYTTPTPNNNPQPIVLVYNEDGTSIIDTLQPLSPSLSKPDWLDNQTNDFKTIYPNGGFYIVIGAGRDNYRKFNLTRRGLGYIDSSPVSVEKEEYKDGYTKYFNELTTDQKNLAFPKIFTKDALLNKFYYDNFLPSGGERDKRFNPSSDVEEESPLETFKNKLETGKYKNKINNWFYNIRKYYDSAFLLDEKDNSDKAQTARYAGKLKIESLKKIELRNFAFREAQGEKVDDISNTIGYQLNPSENTPIWDQEIKSPSSTSPTCDLVKLKITPIEHSYFVRLGTLLEYIQNRIIIKNGKNPFLKIDTEVKTNICYAIDNMVSTNIKKGLIANSNFFVGVADNQNQSVNLFNGLEPFMVKQDNDYIWGQLMNVYLNFNRVEEIFSSVNEKNEIVLFDVLKAICNDINECLGNVNNIEPVIDKESNTIKIIDQTSIPGLDFIASQLGNSTYEDRKTRKKEQEELVVFGYSGTKSNFIRNVGMTTEISKNYATAITIGATAQGEVPGMEATAFSRWNMGVKDRFKNELFDAETEVDSQTTGSLDSQNKSVIKNYKNFISDGYVTLGLNFKSENEITINDSYISENKNTVKNFYVYAQAKTTKENYNPSTNEGLIESSIGFLPINLKLEMDGIGGIRIYDFVKINTEFLPSNYPNTLEFICTGVNHKLENDEWVTSLDTLATSISKTVT